jgi:poly(beta-D-mannuronate) lyase
MVIAAVLLGSCSSGGALRGKGSGGEGGGDEPATGGISGRAGTGGVVGAGGMVTGGAGSGPPAADATAPVPGDAGGVLPEGGVPSEPTSDEPPPCQKNLEVSGAAALGPALAAAKPGDCLMVADGAYGPLTITARGTAAAPIQVRAVNLLKASVTNLRIEMSEHVIVRGFALSTILFVNSNHSRVTRCQVKGPGSGYWVRIEEQKGCMSGCTNTPPGTSNFARVDHCDIGGGSSSSDIFNPTAFATNTRIDHNYIHDTSGPHLMTLGCCGPKYDYFESGTIIEQNLFVNANGTSAEMISIKGANVHFRYNTIRKHNGDIDIRAGKKNSIYGNYILGPGPGIRMYEDDHRIYNNYVVGGLTGNRSGPIHAPLKNATIVHNLFTGGVAVASGNNVVANNILLGGGGGTGNLSGSAASLGFVQMGEILVIGAGSKAIGAATGSYPFVTDDLFGHPRGAKLDVGPQQYSTEPPLRRVLTTADVGPMAP